MAAVLLTLAAFASFWGVQDNDFSRDDSVVILGTPSLQKGLSLEGVRWAFTSTEQANWHPVSWLGHLADWELFGYTPQGPHLVNVGVHAVGAVLLLWTVSALTGAFWRGVLVAALFAVHPLNVEPVAWISDRKDLLAGVFFFLTLMAYVRYAHRPSPGRYCWVAVTFSLGLMSKPMVVTLPCLLLLLDWWPLGRLPRSGTVRVLLEKVPLLALAAASSAITVYAQAKGGALRSLASFPLQERLANAAISYVKYLGKAIWPAELAIIYPYPREGLLQEGAAAAVLLGVLTAAFFAWRTRRPGLLVGWCWFLGMLVPVSGLVQVGDQSLADRFMYLPAVGIFLGASFLAPDLPRCPPRLRPAAGIAVAGVLPVFAAISAFLVPTWKNDLTLSEHAAATVEGNWEAHSYAAFLLTWVGTDQERALRHFRKALEIYPDHPTVNLDVGVALTRWGRPREAIEYLRKAARLSPGSARVHVNLAQALEAAGHPGDAAMHYREALRLEPSRTHLRPIIERLRASGSVGNARP